MNWSDIWVSVGQILVGVALGLLALAGKRTKDWLKKKTMTRNINDNLMVKQMLAEVRSYYDADRVELYQFHNGEYFVSGTSIQKVSLSHFVTARGVGTPIEATHQNIPIGYVSQTADDMVKNVFLFFTGAEMLEDSYFKGLLRYGGARSALLRGVFNNKKDMIAFLAISWFDDLTPTKEQQFSIKEFSMELADELLLGSK